jgi:trehalose synthase-fused probable maltokinase
VHSQGSFDELFTGTSRAELEARLRSYIEPRRWFRSKARAVAGVRLDLVLRLPVPAREIALTVVGVTFEEGPAEQYVLPLTWVKGDSGEHLVQTRPHLVVGAVTVAGEERPRWLIDALGARYALEDLFGLVVRQARVAGDGAELRFRSVGELDPAPLEPRPIESEQSNTSIVYGDRCILKIVRRLEEGAAPDLEMGEFLTRAGYANTPQLLAAIELARPGAEPGTVGAVHAFVPNEGDAWTFALATIAGSLSVAGAGDAGSPVATSSAFVGPLARRVAEMHAALAAPSADPRFSPEPIERPEREALARDVEESVVRAWALADERAAHLPADAVARLKGLRARRGEVDACLAAFVDAASGTATPLKTRVHGDLHLGQVLVSGRDFVLIDFEGEPARPLAARKAKRSPLVDVAGMLRSLHYASVAAWRTGSRDPSGDASGGHPPRDARSRAEAWHVAARREFLRAYDDAARVRSVLPAREDLRSALLRFYLLEKCVYELHYELNNRPDWVTIPVLGLESLLEGT